MSYEVGSRYPRPGEKVRVVEKENYSSGELTEGVVKDVLTSKKFHPRGHKVRLVDGTIGRVQEFVDQDAEKNHQKQELEKSPANSVPYTPADDDLM